MDISLLPIIIVLALIGLGFLCRKSQFLTDDQARGISFFAMNIALPCLLLKAFIKIDLASIFDIRIYLTYFSCAFVVFAIGWGIARFYLKSSSTTCGLLGMGSCFSNLGLIGLPIIETTWGDMGVGIFSIIVSIHPLLLFSLTMMVIAFTSQMEPSQCANRSNPFKSILTNPIIIAIFVGVLTSLSGISWPEPAVNLVEVIGKAAGPCALFTVGTFLARIKLNNAQGYLYASALKVMIMPLCVFIVGHFIFELEKSVVMVLTFLAGLPSGANVSVLSQYYQTAEAEVSSVISAGTLLSLLTLPLIVWLMV